MELRASHINRVGEELQIHYQDADSVEELEGRTVQIVHAYCFCKEKLVVVYDPAKKMWTPTGGGVEPGESVEEAVVREVLEESNMRVIKQRLIGFQDITEPTRTITQTRSVCIVECLGDFVADPDGDISEIKLIEPSQYKDYFNWNEIGDHVMKRALQLKEEMERE